MAMSDPINVIIKKEFIPLLLNSNKERTIDEKVNLSLAIFLYTEKSVTLERASELAGKSVKEFVKILIQHSIPWAEYTEEHKRQDDNTIQFILEEEMND